MKKFYTYILLAFNLFTFAQEKDTNNSEQEKQVKQSISVFFEGFHNNDSIKMKSVCDKKISFHSIHENSKMNMLVDFNKSEFFKMIAGSNKMIFEEKILDYNVQIDGAIAQVWMPYEFYIDGKLSHSGVNVFTLFYENIPQNIGWKIVHIINTRRKK